MTSPDTPRPYDNDFQHWVADSELAAKCLLLWEAGAVSVIVAGFLRTGVFMIVGGFVWLFVTLLVHFWRDELAPKMRYKEGEHDG